MVGLSSEQFVNSNVVTKMHDEVMQIKLQEQYMENNTSTSNIIRHGDKCFVFFSF